MTTQLVQIRTFLQNSEVTLSNLITENFSCKVLELPWRGNKPQVSCIPDGTYKVVWSFSPRFRVFMYEILNVPDRAGVRIHAGNTVEHTLGCPLLGQQIIKHKGKDFATLSRITMKAFEHAMKQQPFTLQIIRR